MLRRRKEGAEKVNALFGTNITVELASSWKDNKEQVEAEIENLDTDEDAVRPPDEVSEEQVQTDAGGEA